MTEPKKKHRYKHAEGKHWIEVRIKNPLQLFDARDPAPFLERDLDDDFVEYIVSSAKEFSLATPLRIVIYIEQAETADLPKDSIRESIHGFLAYRIDVQRRELKRFAKRVQWSLAIGLGMLALALGIAQSLSVPQPPGAMGIVREGIIIFGWVSIWKPIELVLFDWYPLFEELRFYKKLLETEIDIRFTAA